MKKSLVTVCLVLGLLIAAAPGMAATIDQVQVGYLGSAYGPYQTGAGGEFSLKPLDGFAWVLNAYSSDAKVNNGLSFQTFCLEADEYIYPYNARYDVTLSNVAIYGGLDPSAGGDPISKGAAWLYANFATSGNFDGLVPGGYDYTNPGRSGTAISSSQQLQNAIWWLEGDIATRDLSNVFETAVVTKFGSAGAAMANAESGEFGVYALNMWAAGHLGDYNYRRQDQLIYVGVSEPVGVAEPFTLLFLGGCLLGAGIVGRRFRV